jgi:hypothetical protein
MAVKLQVIDLLNLSLPDPCKFKVKATTPGPIYENWVLGCELTTL